MNKAYIEHKIKYLNRKRDILFFQIDGQFLQCFYFSA